MTARGDILHINAMRFLRHLSVVVDVGGEHTIEKRVVDLEDWGVRLVIRSDEDDSVLLDYQLSPGTDHTLADADRNGEIASFVLDVDAADVTFAFAAPVLERTIPVRHLPFILYLHDGTEEGEFARGHFIVRAKVTP